MFLLDPSGFPWDLIIAILLTGFLSVVVCAVVWWKRALAARVWQRMFVGVVGALGLLGFLVILYGSFIEPQIIVVTQESVSFPVQQPLRIAVISDLHVGPFKGEAFVKRTVQTINNLFPDIFLIAGDFVFDERSDVRDLGPLRDLRSSLGTFAVLGNHDGGHFLTINRQPLDVSDRSTELETYLTGLGITTLRNSSRIVPLSNGNIAIAGIDDIWMPGSSVSRSLQDIPQGTPTILLTHNPDTILDPDARKAQLIVAGHTHGGQIRLPFYGPVPALPTHLGRRYDQGIFPLPPSSTLAITRGIGESLARARLFAWPEVMLITTHP